MKSVLINRYGPAEVMVLAENETPAPTGKLVLVRVMQTSVNPVDWKIRRGMLRFMTGRRFPIRLGYDVAGVVEDLGPDAKRFARGDRVFGMLCLKHRGSYAEFAVEEEDNLARIPEGVGFREAGVVPLAALTAYQALHVNCGIRKGESVLINGGSGGVGTFAVQLAKAAGATVTAVCGASNMGLADSLGADEVVDYTTNDITRLSGRYDIFFDVMGNLTFFGARPMLKQGGRYVTTLPGGVLGVLGLLMSPALYVLGYRKRAMMVMVKPSGEIMEKLAGMLADGRLKPVIEREFPLDEIKEAQNYSEAGHTAGKIAIKVG